jgi:hypothetical protein
MFKKLNVLIILILLVLFLLLLLLPLLFLTLVCTSIHPEGQPWTDLGSSARSQ